MWQHSDLDENYWCHLCLINDIKGNIAFFKDIIEMIFQNQYFDDEKKEWFWLNEVGFYPYDKLFVPALVNVKFAWKSSEWLIETYEITEDNLEDIQDGNRQTIIGKTV